MSSHKSNTKDQTNLPRSPEYEESAKVELEKPPAKRKPTEMRQTERKVKAKSVKSKRTQNKQPTGYRPTFMVSPTRESSDEDQFSSEDERFSCETQEHLSFEQELNGITTRHHKSKRIGF